MILVEKFFLSRIQTMDRNAFAGVEEFLSEIYIKVRERRKRNIYVQTDRQTDLLRRDMETGNQ
jgi:hypothetical protein